jgi:hypothetical protein
VNIRIQDLHIRIGFNIRACNFARSFLTDAGQWRRFSIARC